MEMEERQERKRMQELREQERRQEEEKERLLEQKQVRPPTLKKLSGAHALPPGDAKLLSVRLCSGGGHAAG